MEVPILNGLTYADIYVRDINLVIMVNGPNHYYLDEPTILIKSLMDDYVGNYMDVLKLNYDHFDQILRYGPAIVKLQENALIDQKIWLKK